MSSESASSFCVRGDDRELINSMSDSDVCHNDKVRHLLSDDDDRSQVYLSVIWQGGKLGMAYYDLDSTIVYMMLDTTEKDDFHLLRTIKQQIQPTSIVTSSKQDEMFLKVLHGLRDDNPNTSGDSINRSFDNFIHLLPSCEFNLDVCKRRLLSVNLPSIPDHYTDVERTLHMSTLVPFDNVNMVRATGGLLKYLDKKRIGIELEESDVRVPILALKIFSLGDLMIVDDNTFSALQIFCRETHPSVYKIGWSNSGSKEGLSLYGVMNRCRSVVGSKLLRLWFMRPLKNIEILKQRHSAIAFFLNQRNAEVTTTLQSCLKNIKNLPRILSRMKQNKASMGDWQTLYKTAINAVYIADLARVHSKDIYIFQNIAVAFTEELNNIATLINKIVDFDESAIQSRFVVKPNIDPELDERKRTYNGLPDFMTKVARQELERLKEDINECNVIYLPQLGYLLAIPSSNLTEEEATNIPGLNFMFVSNKMHHFKSEATKELDVLLGDTQCEITDHETTIMHRLQDMILQRSDVLLSVMDYASELDCLLSLTECAKEFSYVCPQFANKPGITITGGRHPLQELCCSPFVPNDTNSGGEFSKAKILTGPNASGKSVYLKQVAIIVYMAHIGGYIPAESAVIGQIDRIFTRIRTLESVSVGLSTYMIDLTQVSSSLQSATGNSLVILDEFGKGTEMVDGIALLAACLRYWINKGDECPHLLVSTHFHGIIHQNLLPATPLVSYQTMETIQEGNELIFLYQLIDGYATCSYAGHVAAQAGLPDEIICRGKEVSALLKENKPISRLSNYRYECLFQRCSAIVEKFRSLDLDADDLQKFQQDVLAASDGMP